MKKYKVTWYESVTKSYHTEIEATSAEEAGRMIDQDLTSVIEEDHGEVEECGLLKVEEV